MLSAPGLYTCEIREVLNQAIFFKAGTINRIIG